MFFFSLIFSFPQPVNAQFFKKLLKKAEKKIEREAEKRAERRVNKKIDKEFDKVEGKIDGKGEKKTSKKTKQIKKEQENKQVSKDVNIKEGFEKTTKPKVIWSRFDFVPGDTVIFEDLPSIDEENGEFPGRWDLYRGGAEVVMLNEIPAITIITDMGNMHSKGIVPYLKNSEKDYLPEVFTIEFDGYYNPNKYNESFYITLYDRKNQKRNGISQIEIGVNEAEMGESSGTLVGKRGNRDKVAGWRHVSIAYTRGKMKVYLEDQRLINIPHLKGNPTGITLSARSENMYIKNIRIAKGGVKYYDRVLSEGKIVVNGIKFDVNKTTLKPESMGPINKIFQLMKKQSDLKFSIEGHTDSDGDLKKNKILSVGRAKSVKRKLITMGISKDRLKSKGWGEAKPVDKNGTPEGKANNRRVEFVKF